MHNINISIDDVSPHPLSSTKVIKQCNKIIEKYPEVKFTLFVPVAYWRTMRANVATPQPLELSKFPSFCEELRNLPENNFEVGYHGYHHGIPWRSDNDELKDKNYKDSLSLYKKMYYEVEKAGLSKVFKKILRPPAWRMSPDAIRAAKDFGFEILALSPDKYPDGSLDYKGEDHNFKNVVYYNVSPPNKKLSLFDKTEIVYHACEWDSNYLCKDKTDELIKFIGDNNFKFCFMEDML
jgi:predicted deacetylase|tara:strand:- start:16846 stop:17556 length:711 start_codon:yes stop_codon:yes gene_type:complete